MHLHHYRAWMFIICMSIYPLFSQDALTETDSLVSSEVDNDQEVKEKILDQIDKERNEYSQILSQKISDLDDRIKEIDASLEKEINTKRRIEGLVERVQTLEVIQQALQQKELNLYQRNYQSAVINLVSMERELKPLMLFNSSREFFTSLTDVSNPMNYQGYKGWFNYFKKYVSENKTKDPSLSVLNNLITLTGDLAKGAPLTGPFTQVLFSGMSSFIESMGSRRRELKEKSVEMFELTMVLSQFTHDQQLIENEWDAINAELEELKKLHDQTLNENFSMLDIPKAEFKQMFTMQNDANKRLVYLNQLAKVVEAQVSRRKAADPDGWKEQYYYQMNVIQSLKVRFGTITFRIKENIAKYDELLKKYKENKHLKTKVADLEVKLNQMNDAFDQTFNPKDYIDSATKMYIVN